jgi:phosphinothricin acetyltransferase
MLIRAAAPADLPAVAAIYDAEVAGGIATFDTETRPLWAWEQRLAPDSGGDRFLVALDDEAVVGYANAFPYRPKLGYRHTREVSIYLADGAQGRGVGRRLYDELLGLLAADGVHLALAAIALPNPASLALHRACGFEEVGVMREVGRKFDRWIDVLWLQKRL